VTVDGVNAAVWLFGWAILAGGAVLSGITIAMEGYWPMAVFFAGLGALFVACAIGCVPRLYRSAISAENDGLYWLEDY